MDLHSKRAVTLLSWALASFVFIPLVQASEIHGRILMEPPFPVIQKVKMETKRKDSCDPERIPQSLLISGEGGVRNAVISIAGEDWPGISEKLPEIILDQKNCSFEPHILALTAGTAFRIANADPVDHDVRAFRGAEMLFEFTMAPGKGPVEKSFKDPGVYLIRCGFHMWMHAFVVNLPNGIFDVSGADGRFILRDVPEGRHILKVWHETLGEAEIPVEVSAGVKEIVYQFPKQSEVSS